MCSECYKLYDNDTIDLYYDRTAMPYYTNTAGDRIIVDDIQSLTYNDSNERTCFIRQLIELFPIYANCDSMTRHHKTDFNNAGPHPIW